MEQPSLMNRRRENIVILTVFSTLLLLITVMTIVPGTKTVAVRPPAVAARIDDTAPQETVTRPAVALLDPQAVERRWGADPFARGEAEEGSPRQVAPAAEEDLVLTMVLISGNQKTARINNRSYREGDVVNGARIISIEKDGVLLDRRGGRTMLTRKKRAITLKPSPSAPR